MTWRPGSASGVRLVRVWTREQLLRLDQR
ncbi:MAG: hypothetical protein JWO01_2785, partial [Microbacteriaceae bacterium]|nr:hypothetical protein [Microbacteriaceae bacterium]